MYNYIRIVVIKMKRIIKINIALLIILFMCLVQVNEVYAGQAEGMYGTGKDERTYGWSDKGLSFWKPSKKDIGQNDINNSAKTIVAAVRAIGIVVSIVALMVIGIKQMTASVEEKSIIKQAMPGYILGLILVVSITFLPTLIYNFMQKVN